jgi:hypothetical protein
MEGRCMESEGRQERGQRRREHDTERPLIVEVAQLVLDLARVWNDVTRLARRMGRGAKE